MKRFATAIIVSLAVACAFAGPGKDKTKTPTTIKCAVTGGDVNIADATKNKMFTDYKGNRYFFCCNGCPQEFKKEPAKYSKAPHIKTPKSVKAAK
ncbi:MAG TPA: YHS domain-containing protein [Fimbriimonadaceae bacterium]|jgi:YHS domain-containing protein